MMRQLRIAGAQGRRRGRAALATGVAVVAGGLLASAPALATPRDNVANAKLCLRGGWTTLLTSTGRPFKNAGHCVIYALAGGTFGSPPVPSGGGE